MIRNVLYPGLLAILFFVWLPTVQADALTEKSSGVCAQDKLYNIHQRRRIDDNIGAKFSGTWTRFYWSDHLACQWANNSLWRREAIDKDKDDNLSNQEYFEK